MPKRINQGSRCIFPPPEAAPKRPVEEYVHTLVVLGWRSHSSVPFCIEGWRGLIWAFATFVMSWLAAKMNTNRTCRRMQPPVNRLYLRLASVGGWRNTVRQRKAAPGAVNPDRVITTQPRQQIKRGGVATTLILLLAFTHSIIVFACTLRPIIQMTVVPAARQERLLTLINHVKVGSL